MSRFLLASSALFLAVAASWAQPESGFVLGERTPLLAAGAEAIRAGRYEDGIRLTREGLDTESVSAWMRAAALANLCAAHAANGDPDGAIGYCNDSLAVDARNWRAFSNRAFAYWLKGQYAEAAADLELAAELAPNAPQVRQIRALINERTLQPQVTMEDR